MGLFIDSSFVWCWVLLYLRILFWEGSESKVFTLLQHFATSHLHKQYEKLSLPRKKQQKTFHCLILIIAACFCFLRYFHPLLEASTTSCGTSKLVIKRWKFLRRVGLEESSWVKSEAQKSRLNNGETWTLSLMHIAITNLGDKKHERKIFPN